METKDKIIMATIDLIKEKQDIKKITMRRIAKKADVAVSMINYHFQTKENLINKAVQKFIGTIISNAGKQYQDVDISPEEKMKLGLKRAAKFLANNPGIARVSILNDLKNGSINDNSSQVLESIVKQLKEVYGDKKDGVDLKIMAQQQLATVQVIFLRTSIFKEQTGINYYDDQQRDELMDRIVDNMLGKS
jgi:AcrR family transcriptional regulator